MMRASHSLHWLAGPGGSPSLGTVEEARPGQGRAGQKHCHQAEEGSQCGGGSEGLPPPNPTPTRLAGEGVSVFSRPARGGIQHSTEHSETFFELNVSDL